MIDSPNATVIKYGKINFEIALYRKDFSSADEWADRLSILFLNELVVYSDYIDELEKVKEERKKIIKKIPYRVNINLKSLEEKIKEVKEYYTKINHEWIEVQTARELYSN